MKICVYPGTFDPFTKGHMDVLVRGAALFDRIVVGVLHNSQKRSAFSEEQRVEMIQKCIDASDIAAKCDVQSFSGLTVDFARVHGATAILRGLRATMDFEYESQLAWMNRDMSDALDTVFLLTNSAYAYVSSTLVREIASYGRDISAYVPAEICESVQRHFAARQGKKKDVQC